MVSMLQKTGGGGVGEWLPKSVPESTLISHTSLVLV